MRRGDVVLIADRGGGDFAGKPRPAVIVQADVFDGTTSVIVCPLTGVEVDAPLLRVPVERSDALPLSGPSWVMVEKVTAIRRDRVGRVIDRLSDDEMVALQRSLAVVIGFG